MTAMDIGTYDYVIVGGGSAGCVVASRLSADSGLRVLLIEAGPDFEPGSEPEGLRDRGVRAFMLRRYFWSDLTLSDTGRFTPFMQAKVIGGGSSINGMHAQRGLPRDYDEWRQLGIAGWGWEDVLPYFKRLETDEDFAGPLHGDAGPIRIRRVPEHRWSGLTRALRAALDKRGVPHLDDVNAEDGDCTAPVPLNNSAAERMSASVAYLTPEVRARPNLRILASTEARRILLDDARRVAGVELRDGRVAHAAQLFVCAGAIHSPALLLRSGIGPGEALGQAGIRTVANRPGVGRNLRNHPILTITSHVKRAGRQNDRSVRPPVTMVTRYSSAVPGCEPADMLLNLWERTPGPLEHDPLGRQLSSLMVILNKSHSQGEVSLDPGNPEGPVRIRANVLGDRRDLDRMVQGFRFIASMLTEAPMAGLINSAFFTNLAMGIPPDRLTMKLLQDTLEARLISTAGAFAMDHLPWVRRRRLARSGRSLESVLALPEAEIVAFVRSVTAFGGHPGGTCRLGAADQLKTVVDSRCRVVGVEGLRVVDASIFPTLMTAGTNLPVIMSAEKAADMAIEDRRRRRRPRAAAA